ncbi:hypothetical protein ACP70R_049059 [Stipagrostis hirtigluma subsp. patula]
MLISAGRQLAVQPPRAQWLEGKDEDVAAVLDPLITLAGRHHHQGRRGLRRQHRR